MKIEHEEIHRMAIFLIKLEDKYGMITHEVSDSLSEVYGKEFYDSIMVKKQSIIDSQNSGFDFVNEAQMSSDIMTLDKCDECAL